MAKLNTWGKGRRFSFRILPRDRASFYLKPGLQSDGLKKEEVLRRLPYHRERAESPGKIASARRYRELKLISEAIGLGYQEEDRFHVTAFGKAVLRWLDFADERCIPIIGRNAAQALSAVQLRNPTRAGKKYDSAVKVFPFTFIWKAMLQLDHRISSDELNRAVLKTSCEDELNVAVERIITARESRNPEDMGPELITGGGKNDRIIPWMALASFGWSLIMEKRAGEFEGYYEIRPNCVALLRDAVAIRREHREFDNIRDYVEFVSWNAAVLPPRPPNV